MSNAIWQNDLFFWAVTLVIGFPLLVIVLGEVSHRVQRRSKSLAATLRVVRNLVLPVFVFMLFIQYVLKLDANGNFVKSIETLFWICMLHASLSLVNAVLFAEASSDTWRARVPKLLIDLSRLFLVLLGTAMVTHRGSCRSSHRHELASRSPANIRARNGHYSPSGD